MTHTGGFLCRPFCLKILQTVVDLLRGVAALAGIGINGGQHGDDTAAFFAPTAGLDPVSLLVGSVAGYLVLLKIGEPVGQGFLNQQLGKGTQDGELVDGPAFLQVITGQGVVKISALVKQSVVMGDALEG